MPCRGLNRRGVAMKMEDRIKKLIDTDYRYVWHPFTQMQEWGEHEPLIIEEGRDCFLKDVRGNWYLDGVSSIWVNIHGHRRAELDEAVKAQLDKVAHSTLLGLGNVPSVELAGRLAGVLKNSFGEQAPRRVFYSDNGSTAVEIALKMAFQYWQHKGKKEKNTFLSFTNGYHGDTLGAVSVGGIELFHEVFRPLLFKTYQSPHPYCYRCRNNNRPEDCGLHCLQDLDKVLKAHSGEVAALILEPLIQGAGGMVTAPWGFLSGVRSLCRRYDVLMIADEVATGFGRTGKMFACEHEDVVPDIICLSKGITGGYLPLAATVATEEIYGTFLGETAEQKTFFHGHSYTGNPLACAAALACLDIFEKDQTLETLPPKIAMLEDWFREITEYLHVGDCRNAGLMAGIELVTDKESREPYPYGDRMGQRVAMAARDDGVIVRAIGNIVVIMPPLVIGADDLQHMLDVIGRAIRKVTEG
jgi:adenosylmethionine-8-amino-7-oxononanoate aminotransferase